MQSPYPLSWPTGWPRTTTRATAPFHKRKQVDSGWTRNVDVTMAQARKMLQAELDRLGARDIVLSTNVELTLAGEPRSGRAAPRDVGAACYFKLKNRDTVLACDKWLRVEDNIVAITKHIEALRGQARWGVGSVEQAFTGYQALPAPDQVTALPWRAVMGFEASASVTRAGIDTRYRDLARIHHPDRGGARAAWDDLVTAYEQAKVEVAGA